MPNVTPMHMETSTFKAKSALVSMLFRSASPSERRTCALGHNQAGSGKQCVQTEALSL